LHFNKLFRNYRKIKTPIKGKRYTLAVADTEQKKRLGLSQLKILPRGCGMIFVYDNPVNHAFTMENTKIPLTIMFLSKDFEVLEVFKCRPFEKKKVRPKSDYSYVIEIWYILNNIIFS